MSDTESNQPIVMNEEQMTYFKQFCEKEDQKKERARCASPTADAG